MQRGLLQTAAEGAAVGDLVRQRAGCVVPVPGAVVGVVLGHQHGAAAAEGVPPHPVDLQVGGERRIGELRVGVPVRRVQAQVGGADRAVGDLLVARADGRAPAAGPGAAQPLQRLGQRGAFAPGVVQAAAEARLLDAVGQPQRRGDHGVGVVGPYVELLDDAGVSVHVRPQQTVPAGVEAADAVGVPVELGPRGVHQDRRPVVGEAAAAGAAGVGQERVGVGGESGQADDADRVAGAGALRVVEHGGGFRLHEGRDGVARPGGQQRGRPFGEPAAVPAQQFGAGAVLSQGPLPAGTGALRASRPARQFERPDDDIAQLHPDGQPRQVRPARPVGVLPAVVHGEQCGAPVAVLGGRRVPAGDRRADRLGEQPVAPYRESGRPVRHVPLLHPSHVPSFRPVSGTGLCPTRGTRRTRPCCAA